MLSNSLSLSPGLFSPLLQPFQQRAPLWLLGPAGLDPPPLELAQRPLVGVLAEALVERVQL